MKDYSDWEPMPDYENDSPWVDPNRPWLKYRPPIIPKTVRFDPIPLHEFIKQTAREFPNNVCVDHKPLGLKSTYRELIKYADQIANALYELGIRKGDGVGIMSANCPEFVYCLLGVMETGAIAVPINPMLKEADVTHIARDSGIIKAIFVHSASYRTIKKTRKVVDIPHVIMIRSEKEREDTITYEEFIEGKEAKPPEVDFDPDNDIVALMYTGGTTGLPKGVMLTHSNLVSAVLSVLYNQPISAEEREAMSGKRTMMAVAPLCHIQGYLTLCIVLRAAMMCLMLGRFDPGEILETIEDYKISVFGGLPVMYQMIINHPDFRKRDLSSITSSISGGAALAPELARIWHEVVGSEVGQGYGLTESAGMGNNLAPWMPRGIVAESVSVPIVDMDLKIVNPDTLEELPPGEVGEMLLRGPLIMKGYWKNPEATAKDLVDGWLRTGDLGKMDEDGYFYIEGRSKDMVKYKGYKVMPKEVEIKLMEHPAVLEAGVVGVPDPNIGETIKAFIVLKKEDKGKVTEQEIIEWSKEKLAGYKWPRKVEFIDSLPRTGVGKIKRRKLREQELEKESS